MSLTPTVLRYVLFEPNGKLALVDN